MEDLVSRQRVLDHAIRKCRADVRAARKKATESVRKTQNFAARRPSAVHQKYLFIFMMEAGGDAAAALSMLRREPRLKLHWHDWTTEQQRLYIEDFVFSLAWPDLLAKIEHLGRTEPRIVERARTLFAEAQTATWVSNMNTQQALTPTSAGVVRFCGPRAPTAWPDLRSAGAQRSWASRWRKRWNARMGKLKVGDMDDVDSMREKAVWGVRQRSFSA
jgi:hypothetical protein